MREIFKYLTEYELADIASTCARFRTIARDVFWLKFLPNLVFSLNEESDLISCRHRQQTAAVLRNFGDFCPHLKVTFHDGDAGSFHNTIVFNLLVKYCGETLEQLELTDCNHLQLQPNEINDGKQLFRNIKELILDNSSAIDSRFLSDAKQLTQFYLFRFYATKVVKYLSNEYPRLQKLILDNNLLSWGKIKIVKFLKRYPKLIELELNGSGKYDFSSIDQCQWLRELNIWDCQDLDYSTIAQLDQLTAFRISVESGEPSVMEVLKTSKSSQSIEELQVFLVWVDGKELLTVFLRFINLKQLSFGFVNDVDDHLLLDLHCLKNLRVLSVGGTRLSLTSDGLVELVQQLPDLEQLSVFAYYDQYMELMESTYLSICNICRTRNRKLEIYNFDLTANEQRRLRREEPFVRNNQREFVRYFVIDHNELETNYDNVKI